MSEELVKAYITQYALTQGIYTVQGYIDDSRRCLDVFANGILSVVYSKTDWHLTYEEAVARAEEMRQKKIASLEKQLAKLKALTFPEMEGADE